jgi:hypothetical protein
MRDDTERSKDKLAGERSSPGDALSESQPQSDGDEIADELSEIDAEPSGWESGGVGDPEPPGDGGSRGY